MFSDGVMNVKGHIIIEAYNKEGELTYSYEKKNKIILPTIHKVSKSLMGIEKAENLSFLYLKFGSGGNDSEGLVIEPTGEETNLRNEVRSFSHKGIPGNLFDDATGYELVSPIKCDNKDKVNFKFQFEFDAKDGNAVDGSLIKYSEIGLFFESGDMFAYRTFPEINKDDNTSLVIKWSFQFYSNREDTRNDLDKPAMIVSPTDVTLKKGETMKLDISLPQGVDYTVTSKNPTIARFDKNTSTINVFNNLSPEEGVMLEFTPIRDDIKGVPVNVKVKVIESDATISSSSTQKEPTAETAQQ